MGLMIRNIILSLSIIFIANSCKITEEYFSDTKFQEVEQKIIEDPKRFIGQDLNTLLKEFKSEYDKYTFYEERYFILSGIIFSFEDFSFKANFDWKNTTYNFREGLKHKNNWDFERLKEEKIRSITIRKKNETIYAVQKMR